MSAILEEPRLSAPPRPLLPIRVRAKFFFDGEEKFFLKGATYGPFAPDAEGFFVGTPAQARRDFEMVQALGINLLRLYHVPPVWFLDLCREFRLRVLISIPWAEHVEFLNNKTIRRQVVQTIRDAVLKNRGHEAIFGYFVGNEIPTTMVRWLGARRRPRDARCPRGHGRRRGHHRRRLRVHRQAPSRSRRGRRVARAPP